MKKAEEYLDQLEVARKPHVLITRFYCDLFGLDRTDQRYKMFGSLLKVYKKENIFFALLDMYHVYQYLERHPNKEHDWNFNEDMYTLIAHFCKKRLEKNKKKEKKKYNDLDKYKKDFVKFKNKSREGIELPEEFDEE